MTVWQAAVRVIRRNDCDGIMGFGIMWGDLRLAHEIADELGWEQRGIRTHHRVIAALGRTPGTLSKRLTQLVNGRWVLAFDLPDPSLPIPASTRISRSKTEAGRCRRRRAACPGSVDSAPAQPADRSAPFGRGAP